MQFEWQTQLYTQVALDMSVIHIIPVSATAHTINSHFTTDFDFNFFRVLLFCKKNILSNPANKARRIKCYVMIFAFLINFEF